MPTSWVLKFSSGLFPSSQGEKIVEQVLRVRPEVTCSCSYSLGLNLVAWSDLPKREAGKCLVLEIGKAEFTERITTLPITSYKHSFTSVFLSLSMVQYNCVYFAGVLSDH